MQRIIIHLNSISSKKKISWTRQLRHHIDWINDNWSDFEIIAGYKKIVCFLTRKTKIQFYILEKIQAKTNLNSLYFNLQLKNALSG